MKRTLLVTLLLCTLAVGCERDAGTVAPAGGGNVIELTAENFDEVVLQSTKPVLVDFWATWCRPCREIAPVVEQISVEYADRLVVGKLDVDAQKALAKNYEFSYIPYLAIFRNGRIEDNMTGNDPRELRAMVERAVSTGE